jgi:hypothetical protein
MQLTEDQIKAINEKCPYNQGVFFQPNHIPIHIKELVIYTRYETGGVSGGSCWDSSNPQPYDREPPKDKFKVLDLVLAELMPNITYLQFKQIDALVKDNEDTEFEYYGNRTNYKAEYIILSELYKLLESFKC